MNRQQIISLLTTGQAIIHFTKVDGTSRSMRATLCDKFFTPPPSKNSGRTASEDTIVAWDLERDGWRSFRVDSVTNVESL